MAKSHRSRGITDAQGQTWHEAIRQNTRERPQTTIALKRRWAPVFASVCGFLVLAAVAGSAWAFRDAFHVIARQVLLGEGRDGRVEQIDLSTNGMLSEHWLKEELELFEGAHAMGADIFELQARLESIDQIHHAKVTRSYAQASFSFELVEREAVFKLIIATSAGRVVRLVDVEGVVFEPIGYSNAQLKRLPWVGGVTLNEGADGYQPIPEIPRLVTVLQRTRELAPRLAQDLQVVELEKRSRVSPLLGEYVILRTRWCQRMVLTEERLDDQLIDLDVVIAEASGDWDAVNSTPMAVIDLTVEGRAMVKPRPRKSDGRPRAGSPFPPHA